jgi:two-component system, OmpR family, response regulator
MCCMKPSQADSALQGHAPVHGATLRRILQVDDEPDILTIGKLSLEMYGKFEVAICAAGDQALATALQFSPDLILLDLMMPGTDGFAVMEALKAHPATRDVPVVYLTATLAPDLQKRLIAGGAVGVIVKPFNPRELSDKVRELWDQFITRRTPLPNLPHA